MNNKENLKKLNFFLKDPAFLDLEVNLAMQMAKRLKKNKRLLKNKFSKVKLSILSNFNIDFILEAIHFCLYQRGIDAEITTSSYGTMFTELLNSKSSTYKNIMIIQKQRFLFGNRFGRLLKKIILRFFKFYLISLLIFILIILRI